MFESLDVGIALLAGFLSGVAVPIGHPYVVAGAFDSVTGHGLTDGASLAANVLSELSLFFFRMGSPVEVFNWSSPTT